MVITLASTPLTTLSESEKINLTWILWEQCNKKIEWLLALKTSSHIDGWIMRRAGDIVYTTIFYTHLSRTLQSMIFWWQKNISDTLEDKKMSIKVKEDVHGEEIIVFPGWEVIYDKGTINMVKNIPGGKRLHITQNELDFLKNGDIKSVQDYLKELYNV